MTTLLTDLIDKDRGFRVWGEHDLYDEKTGTGFVPNPKDWIVHDDNIVERVLTVNYATPSWTVEVINAIPVKNTDKINGGHYPLRSDKYRIYFDTTKNPATMVVDNNITFNGPDVDGIRIFRGTDISDNGEILSGFYKNGRLDKNYLPMQTISKDGVDTVVKSPLPGSLLAPVEHGESFSYVVYADSGDIIEIGTGYFIKTNLVMPQDTASRQVLDIKLVSPFIVDDNGTVLTLPINIPLDSIPLSVVVKYSDGEKKMNIDGSRVILNGIRNAGSHDTYYLSTNAGNELPLTLSYLLAKGETYLGENLINGTIFKDYTAVTETVDGAYSMKLFVVPKWLNANQGYRLQYYLYNLTRGQVYDATAACTLTGGQAFDPMLYGVKQRLNVQCDISKVDAKFRAFIQAQSFSITLVNPGTELNTNYFIEYLPDGLKYGEGIWATFKYSNVNYSEIDVRCGKATKAEWLAALYDPSYPLYDRRNESGPLEPTHFEIHVGGQVVTAAVDDWMSAKVVNYKVGLDDTLVIRWLRRTPTDTLQLACSPMLAHNIS
ncbi:hypothetical protein pEaSNUABM10_00275 [Erwinia phage pEa_SNUABM_10]|nr:hypothetical protein pEaSNUABM10_00275 [Erwinia phage pEa_SNUABM_10]